MTLIFNGFSRLGSRSHRDRTAGIPGRSCQHDMRQAEVGADLGRPLGDRGGEWVRGVHDRLDAVVDEPLPHRLGAAEPADPHFPDRQRGVGHASGQRTDDLIRGMQSLSEFASLGAAAEHQHLHQCLRFIASHGAAGPPSTDSCR
jgi:hypothetical protein